MQNTKAHMHRETYIPFVWACLDVHMLLQVVPTIYSNLRNDTISTNQYSVTEHFKESNIPMQHNLPGVFFYYDLSPIKVTDISSYGAFFL